MSRDNKYGYSERFTTFSVGEDQSIIIYVTEDLDDDELKKYFEIALSKENFEYCYALAVEALTRGIKFKL